MQLAASASQESVSLSHLSRVLQSTRAVSKTMATEVTSAQAARISWPEQTVYTLAIMAHGEHGLATSSHFTPYLLY